MTDVEVQAQGEEYKQYAEEALAAIVRVCRGSVALAPQIGEVPFEWAGNSPPR